MSRSPQEENRMYDPWTQARDPAADAEMDAEMDAMIIAIRQKLAMARESAIAAAHTPLWPVMPTPTASSPALPVECVAEYLNSGPKKTAKALKNLAAGGYVIRVSSDPDRWVRVVSVEVDTIEGVVQPLANEASQQ